MKWAHASLKANLRHLSDMKGMEVQSGRNSKMHTECLPVEYKVAASRTLAEYTLVADQVPPSGPGPPPDQPGSTVEGCPYRQRSAAPCG